MPSQQDGTDKKHTVGTGAADRNQRKKQEREREENIEEMWRTGCLVKFFTAGGCPFVEITDGRGRVGDIQVWRFSDDLVEFPIH